MNNQRPYDKRYEKETFCEHETKTLSSSTEGRGSSFKLSFKGRSLDPRPMAEDDKASTQSHSSYYRRIKSFARCAGRMTPAQKLAVDAVLPQYLWTKDTIIDKPLILDIGFGMGHSLATQAAQYPDIHFLGVEVFLPGAARLATLLQEKHTSNVHIAYGDVVLLLKDQLPLHSLAGVQIFFPDPWPKKRHHKRRLLQADFLDLLLAHMKPGAFLHFASDWADYCVAVKALLTACPKVSFAKPLSAIEVLQRPQTRYESRGKVQGHEIEDIVVWLPEQDSNL